MTGHRRPLRVTALSLALAVAAGCSSVSMTASSSARGALSDPTPTSPTPTQTTPPPPTCTPEEKDALDPLESFAPDRTVATPPVADSPTLRDIVANGRLVAGVDENTPGFAVRDETTGELTGLEIDLVREVAKAIWPADASHIDDRIKWVSVVTDQKVPYVRDGKLDLTASTITMNCDRWKQVAFSTSYFTTPQRIMVRTDSDIASIDDLEGRKVCVTKGSSTIGEIQKRAPGAEPVEVEARTDCLVELQDGLVDAVATHDTILFGLHAQDPATTRVVADQLSTSNYGIALPHDDVSFVRFVNGILEQLRADGRFATLYAGLRARGYEPPPIPAPQYRSES